MFPGSLDRQELNLVGMADCGAVTVLALDRGVRRCIQHLDLFFVTLDAALAALVLDGKILPFLLVAQSMEVVGKTVAVDPEIVGYEELAGHKNCYHQSDGQP
jgi:hypothetical protein